MAAVQTVPVCAASSDTDSDSSSMAARPEVPCCGIMPDKLREYLGSDPGAAANLQSYGRMGPSGFIARGCKQQYTASRRYRACHVCYSAWWGQQISRRRPFRKPRTQGTRKGALALKVQALVQAKASGAVPRAQWQQAARVSHRRVREQHERAQTQLQALRKTLADVLSPKALASASAECKAFLGLVLRVQGAHELPPGIFERWSAEVSNGWREGKAVHGRRYKPGDAAISMGIAMGVRQQRSLARLLTDNHVATLPSKKTIDRLIGGSLVQTFGVQPQQSLHAQFFGKRLTPNASETAGSGNACSSASSQRLTAPMRLHVAFDEVSVDRNILHIKHSEGYEIAGLANRVARERSPESCVYIIATPTDAQSDDREEGRLVVERTPVDSPLVRQELPISQLDCVLNSTPRARNVCLWLLFEPERGTAVTVAAAVPTMGDMTVVDDATFLHSIVVEAKAAALPPVCFVGADYAHTPFFKGIVRAITLQELAALQQNARTLLAALASSRLTSASDGSAAEAQLGCTADNVTPACADAGLSEAQSCSDGNHYEGRAMYLACASR